MAYRAAVFLLTVIAAATIGLFLRRGEPEATRAGRKWPGPAEMAAQDVLLRAQAGPAPHAHVVIVAADDKSVAKYGKLPWSRDVWARGLRPVQTGGAKAAIFDIALDERTRPRPDAALWRAMANGRRTVLGMGYDATRARWTVDDVRSLRFLEKFALADKVVLRGAAATQVFPWPQFEPPVSDFTGSARGVGVFVREEDPDRVIRHARLLYLSRVETPPTPRPLPPSLPESRLDTFQVALPSLALAGALQTFDLDKQRVRVDGQAVKIDGELSPPVIIPIDSFSRMVINYAGPAGTYETVSFTDVADARIPPERFRGKTVIFGVTAGGAEETDRRLTPRGQMPRVEITANAVGSILSRSYIARTRGNAALALFIGLGVLAGLLLARRRAVTVFLIGVLLVALYLIAAWCLLTFARVLLPILPALLLLGLATLLALALCLIFAARENRTPLVDPMG